MLKNNASLSEESSTNQILTALLLSNKIIITNFAQRNNVEIIIKYISPSLRRKF